MITLTANGTQLELDRDLWWSDEFAWSATARNVERSVTGAMIVDVAAKIGGRPITLKPPTDNSAWMLTSVVRQLQAWEALPGLQLTLSLRGEVYAVIFNDQGVTADPVRFVANPVPGGIGDWHRVTLRLLTV